MGATSPSPTSTTARSNTTCSSTGKSGFKLTVNGQGETKAGKVNLTPGTYTIYCDIPTHREAGMQAKLIVTEAPPSGANSGPQSSGN